jgi:hypothetical protein
MQVEDLEQDVQKKLEQLTLLQQRNLELKAKSNDAGSCCRQL